MSYLICAKWTVSVMQYLLYTVWLNHLPLSLWIYFQFLFNHVDAAAGISMNRIFTNSREKMVIRSHLWVSTDKRLITMFISFELRKEFRQQGCHIRQTEKGTGGSIIWHGRCWEEQSRSSSVPFLLQTAVLLFQFKKKNDVAFCFVIVVGWWYKWICIYRRGNGWQDWMKVFFLLLFILMLCGRQRRLPI